MKVATSLMANGAWSNACMIQAAMLGAKFYPRTTRRSAANPLVNHYVTRDGKRFMICCLDLKKDWRNLCRALDHPELMEDERFRTPQSRWANSSALIAMIDERVGSKGMAEWAEIFRQNDLTWAPVLNNAEVASDPQMEQNGVFAEIAPGMRTVNNPLNIFGSEKVQPRMAPGVGEHTFEVLRSIGYSEEAMADLLRRGAAMIGKSEPSAAPGMPTAQAEKRRAP
jgi:formyl-CoA transferase